MIYGILFILGLCFGSFGSVITHRLGRFSLGDIREGKKELGTAIKSILIGRSQCPSCHHTLHAKDLIPILSFVLNTGRCRYCKKAIGWTYPLLEIGSGLLFVRIGYFGVHAGLGLYEIGGWLLVSWALYQLMIYDIQKGYLHEPIRAISTIITMALLFMMPGFLPYYALQWGVLFFIFFLGIYYLARLYVWIRRRKHEDGFGIGDVRLSPIIGTLFGILQTWHTNSPSMLDGVALFQRYIIITGVAGLLYAGGQKLLLPQKSVKEIPFFPGMILGLWAIIMLL